MKGSQAGFTLIEMLIGLALLGLLFVGLIDGLAMASRALGRTGDHIDHIESSAIAQDTLRTVLSRAYPGFSGANPPDDTIDFDGAADQLHFLAPLPDRFGVADIVRWDLRAREGGLHLSWRLDRDPSGGFPAETLSDTVLLQGVSSLEIGYYGSDKPGEARSWRAAWSRRKALPELIRVRAVPTSPDWPELVIAPRSQVPADCLYDPSDPLGCRRR